MHKKLYRIEHYVIFAFFQLIPLTCSNLNTLFQQFRNTLYTYNRVRTNGYQHWCTHLAIYLAHVHDCFGFVSKSGRVQIIRWTRYEIARPHYGGPNLIRAIAVITIAIEVIRTNGGTVAGVTAVVTLVQRGTAPRGV